MKSNLIYNVYIEDVNAREIQAYNVFSHWGFLKDLFKIKTQFKKEVKRFKKENDISTCLDKFQKWIEKYKKDVFEEQLLRSLQYYFWCKCEYEVVITDWPTTINAEEFNRIKNSDVNAPKYRFNITPCIEEKVDVYSQVILNKDLFVNYVWSNLDSIKEVK